MKIACLYPLATNIDLIKTIGLNMFLLKDEFGHDCKIICYKNGEYPYLNSEVKGMGIDFIDRKHSSEILNCIPYLIKNSKNIDVLRCSHYSLPTFLYFFIYKIFNRKGIIYFTIDTDYPTALRLNGHKKGIRYKLKSVLSVFLFKHVIDFATIETKKAYEVFIKSNKIYEEKIIYVLPFLNLDPKIEKKKKKQVVTVCRIGSHQKATDIVLKSFKNIFNEIKDTDWILKVVGRVDVNFKKYIDDFFNKNPELKNRIIFPDNIQNRQELFELYAESKIFFLPSGYGSFEIVFAEALYYNFLFNSDVGVGNYLVELSDYGEIVKIDDVEDISNKLLKAIKNIYQIYEENQTDFKKLIHDEFNYKYNDLTNSMIEKSR